MLTGTGNERLLRLLSFQEMLLDSLFSVRLNRSLYSVYGVKTVMIIHDLVYFSPKGDEGVAMIDSYLKYTMHS